MNKIGVIGSLNMDTIIQVEKMPEEGENIFLEAIENSFGGKGGNIGDMLTSFLDKNKDGNVMDDIMGGIGNLFGGK